MFLFHLFQPDFAALLLLLACLAATTAASPLSAEEPRLSTSSTWWPNFRALSWPSMVSLPRLNLNGLLDVLRRFGVYPGALFEVGGS